MALSFVLTETVFGTERCLLFPWRRSAATVAPVYEAPRVSAPTSYVVERPIVVSQPVVPSIPIRVSPPVYETLRVFESSVPVAVSTGTVTVISATPVVSPPLYSESVSIVRRSPVESSSVLLPEYEPFSSDSAPRSVLLETESLRPLRRIEERREPDRKRTYRDVDETTDPASRQPVLPEERPSPMLLETPPDRAHELLLRPPAAPESAEATEPASAFTPRPRSRMSTVLGQQTSTFAGDIQSALSAPPPLPEGPVDSSMIPQRLLDDPVASDPVFPPAEHPETAPGPRPARTMPAAVASPSKRDQWTLGSLLVATIVSTMTLIYVLIMALDYRQRWMQSLTLQNGRFSDFSEDEDLSYDFSEGPDSYGMGSSYIGSSEGFGYRRFGEFSGAGY